MALQLFFSWTLWWKMKENSSFELIKCLYECYRFANQFQLKNISLDNKSVKWIQRLDKIFLYKQVIINRKLFSGTQAQIYVLQNSKSAFLCKIYFIRAAGLGLWHFITPCFSNQHLVGLGKYCLLFLVIHNMHESVFSWRQ